MLLNFIEVILHLDVYLQAIVNEYAMFSYVILFLIVFLETGVVVTPFLPGDSLLFTAGALSATGAFRVVPLFLLIFTAAVLGDTMNYHAGKYVGPKVFKREDSFFFHKEHLVRAEKFYEKHGRKTIILARFIPIIRTFAPFVAGIGIMPYRVFILYNIVGGLLWSALFIFGGYWFGNLPWVEENFGLLILVIIFLSITPIIKEVIYHYFQKK